MKRVISALLIFFGTVSFIFGTPITINNNTKIVIVRYIHDGNKIYKYDKDGVIQHYTDYLDEIGLNDKTKKLEIIINKILEKNKKARTIEAFSLVTMGSGIAFAIIGGILADQEYQTEYDKWWNAGPGSGLPLPEDKSIESYSIGGGVAMVSLVAFLLSEPIVGLTEDILLEYINRFNSLNPDRQIQVY